MIMVINLEITFTSLFSIVVLLIHIDLLTFISSTKLALLTFNLGG